MKNLYYELIDKIVELITGINPESMTWDEFTFWTVVHERIEFCVMIAVYIMAVITIAVVVYNITKFIEDRNERKTEEIEGLS